MDLTFYKMGNVLEIVPAHVKRDWMDATQYKYAYRCVPISIANASGWEFLCPFDIQATWNGGDYAHDLTLTPHNLYTASHFGHGIITFQIGYLLRTSPGWGTWFRGSPNTYKGILAPLEGFVETDWLPFTTTMNWRFTEPGTIKFEKGEPFCFVIPMQYEVLEKVQPEIKDISDAPEEEKNFNQWRDDRDKFLKDANRNPFDWPKVYARGRKLRNPLNKAVK